MTFCLAYRRLTKDFHVCAQFPLPAGSSQQPGAVDAAYAMSHHLQRQQQQQRVLSMAGPHSSISATASASEQQQQHFNSIMAAMAGYTSQQTPAAMRANHFAQYSAHQLAMANQKQQQQQQHQQQAFNNAIHSAAAAAAAGSLPLLAPPGPESQLLQQQHSRRACERLNRQISGSSSPVNRYSATPSPTLKHRPQQQRLQHSPHQTDSLSSGSISPCASPTKLDHADPIVRPNRRSSSITSENGDEDDETPDMKSAVCSNKRGDTNEQHNGKLEALAAAKRRHGFFDLPRQCNADNFSPDRPNSSNSSNESVQSSHSNDNLPSHADNKSHNSKQQLGDVSNNTLADQFMAAAAAAAASQQVAQFAATDNQHQRQQHHASFDHRSLAAGGGYSMSPAALFALRSHLNNQQAVAAAAAAAAASRQMYPYHLLSAFHSLATGSTSSSMAESATAAHDPLAFYTIAGGFSARNLANPNLFAASDGPISLASTKAINSMAAPTSASTIVNQKQ